MIEKVDLAPGGSQRYIDGRLPDEAEGDLVVSTPTHTAPTIRPATRADVARHAGVSTAVVSYVVNEGPRKVAPRTAARVRAAIEELQYSPNVNARALLKGTTGMVGLVLPDTTNPYFAEFAHAVETAAAAASLVVTVSNSGSREDSERRMVELVGPQVDGLLVASVRPPSALSTYLRPHRPLVLINTSAPVLGLSTVGADARAGAANLVRHLVEAHGHTNIALVIGRSTEPLPEPREQGFTEALAAEGLAPGPVVRVDFSAQGGYEAVRQVLSWRTRPTAIFLSSDQQAFGAYRAVRELGLECPTDVALVSYDGTFLSEYCWPPLTVIRQPIQEMAVAALQMVLKPPAEPQDLRFATELVVRESCGCEGQRQPG